MPAHRHKFEDSRRTYDEEEEYRHRLYTEPDQRTTPLKAERRGTDKGCLYVFVGFVAFLLLTLVYVEIHGSLTAYSGFTDYRNNICGTSPAVASKPFMYICQGEDGGLDDDHPICVEQCPTSSETQSDCPANLESSARPGPVDDYPTKPYGAKLCMPTEDPHKAQVAAKLDMRPGIKIFLAVTAVMQDYYVIVGAAAFAMILGFSHMFILRYCGVCFVWLGFFLMIGMPIVLGFKLIKESADPDFQSLIVGDSLGAYVTGVCLIVAALLFGCILAAEYTDLLIARTVSKAAVECIIDSCSLIVWPLFGFIVRVSMFIVLFRGFLLLLSCGGWSWQGFSTTGPLPSVVLLYIFGSFWLLEVVNSLSQYVTACVTEEWFFGVYDTVLFTKRVEPDAVTKSLCTGLRYHMGTLAMAAFVLPLIRVPRFILHYVERLGSQDNGVGRCISQCCSCCIECYDLRIACVNRSVYMELALNGLPFWPACLAAAEVLSDDATDVLSMHGASWLLELGAAGGITALSIGFMHLMCLYFVPFQDPTSRFHVANPMLAEFVVAIFTYPIALDFLAVVVHVSDTLLFCCAVERYRNPIVTAIEGVGDGLVGAMHSCASSRNDPKENFIEEVNHLPSTRELLHLVTRERDEDKQREEKRRCCHS